jgi:MtN3 and saliva related transmembrane protein
MRQDRGWRVRWARRGRIGKDREAYRSAQKAANARVSGPSGEAKRPGNNGFADARHRRAAMAAPGRRLRAGGYHPDCFPTGLDMEWMGYLAAVLTTVAFVPQALKTIRSRDTGGISLAMYVVFTIGIACWFGYGVWLGSWPMILSNIVTFALAATILALKLKHG